MGFPAILVVLLLAACFLGGGCAGDGPTLLESDFQKDPVASGWALAAFRQETPDGEWTGARPGAADRALLVRHGFWQSPPLETVPLAYYRLRFRSKTAAQAYWSAAFIDAEGNELAADVYDGIDPSAAWSGQEFCFRAHADAVRTLIRFQPISAPLAVDDVTVEGVLPETAAGWCDAVYAELPPVDFPPPDGRGRLIPRTMECLAAGGTLRVVILGDSIACDVSNSLFEALLARPYPEARLEVVTSVRGGTGCEYYQAPGRVQEHVLRYAPDLVIIAGISHGYDAEAIRSVIRQVRAASDAEVLVLTGAVCPRSRMEETFLKCCGLPEAAAREVVRGYPQRLRRMLDEEQVELLDLRSAWDAYIERCDLPLEWFMRDVVHANARGKQVLARLLLGYFQPRA